MLRLSVSNNFRERERGRDREREIGRFDLKLGWSSSLSLLSKILNLSLSKLTEKTENPSYILIPKTHTQKKGVLGALQKCQNKFIKPVLNS